MAGRTQSLSAGLPVIASVKDEAGLAAALDSPIQTIFILFSDISSIESVVARCKGAGRTVLVNMDFVDGYAPKPSAVEHLRSHTVVDGILSSKAPLLRAAGELGMLTVHRLFMIDSFAYHQFPAQVKASSPDYIEILPGCVPQVIEWVRQDCDLPVIAGGLVCEIHDVKAALKAGASAITTSCQDLWTKQALAEIGS
jgi:glycerol uptake operon antiterminator